MKLDVSRFARVFMKSLLAPSVALAIPSVVFAADNAQASVCVHPTVVSSFYRLVDKFEKHPLVRAAKLATSQDPEEVFRFTMIAAEAAHSEATRFKCVAFGVRVEPAIFVDKYVEVGRDARGATFTNEWASATVGEKGVKLLEILAQPGNWETMQDFHVQRLGDRSYKVIARYRIVENEEFSEVVSLSQK